MKYLTIIIAAAVLNACTNFSSSEKKDNSSELANGITSSTFKVWGNCEMCKETIEESLKIDGVTKADWNTETKMILVNYDSTKVNLDKIQKNIASVGYDNVEYKGDDKAYSALPGCCQYDRK